MKNKSVKNNVECPLTELCFDARSTCVEKSRAQSKQNINTTYVALYVVCLCPASIEKIFT